MTRSTERSNGSGEDGRCSEAEDADTGQQAPSRPSRTIDLVESLPPRDLELQAARAAFGLERPFSLEVGDLSLEGSNSFLRGGQRIAIRVGHASS